MGGSVSLSELNLLVKSCIQDAFPEQIWLIAEISEMKVNRNGHCYLELVEKNNLTEEIAAKARATIWSWQYRFIQPYFETSTGQTLSAGIKVLVSVSIEFHEVYGYSLKILDIDPSYTLGDLAKKKREILKKLEEQGVIDMNKEIEFPEIPSKIAVISSPTAAGYEDFVNQLLNNSSGYKFDISLYSSIMQGNEAPGSIIDSLSRIYENEDEFDVVVIIRGGGSQSDLNCFDDYELAMNIAQFPLPVVTGIGHEKDESIADIVANTKLKTPTAVAEFLISKFDDVASFLDDLESNLLSLVNHKVRNETNKIESSSHLLKSIVTSKFEKKELVLQHLISYVKPSVSKILEQQELRIRHLNKFLVSNSNNYLIKKGMKLSNFTPDLKFRCKMITDNENSNLNFFYKSVDLINPVNVLKRGYSITYKNGKVLKGSKDILNGDIINTILFDGEISSVVKK